MRQSKSNRAGLQLSVGRFHRWMADVRIAKFIHEYASLLIWKFLCSFFLQLPDDNVTVFRYAAVYFTAGMENLLEELVMQCMPNDSETMLTSTILEHAIANNGDLWGLLQPYAHLNAGRVASGEKFFFYLLLSMRRQANKNKIKIVLPQVLWPCLVGTPCRPSARTQLIRLPKIPVNLCSNR